MRASILTLLILLSPVSNAVKPTTISVMNEALDAFIKLAPYVGDSSAFKDPENSEFIMAQSERMLAAFRKGKNLKKFKEDGFNPSYKIIREHLEDTVLSFSSGHKDFALVRLKATAGLCMTCHSQLDYGPTSHVSDRLNLVKKSAFKNSKNYADFLYLVRDYDKAVINYRQALDEFSREREKKYDELSKGRFAFSVIERDVIQSVKRVVSIYTKILNKPSKAVAFIKGLKENKKIHMLITAEVAQWEKGLDIWSDGPQDALSEKKLRKLIEKHLVPIEKKGMMVGVGDNDVDLMVMSGHIYRFLNDGPKSKNVPEYLYWLGVAERRLGGSYLYSLSEHFLKLCVEKYPRHKYAKKCLDEYKDYISQGYSGSSGSGVPFEEQKEISRLEALIK